MFTNFLRQGQSKEKQMLIYSHFDRNLQKQIKKDLERSAYILK